MKQLLGVLLLVGLILAYWKIALLIVIVVMVVMLAPGAWQAYHNKRQARRAAAAEIAARADMQHAQVMAGDMRGLYGMYEPAC